MSGVWDLDTDTQLASGDAFGSFLDFDLKSGLALYRQENYDPITGRDWFTVEVRNKVGDLLMSLEDEVSHEPEAFFVSEGQYVLKRTNDPDSLELTLELYRVDSGERVWRRTPGGSPRWRLSQDSRTLIELLSERSENAFHTAIAFDTLTLAEVDRCDLSGFKVRRERNYLTEFNTPVVPLAGQSGTLLFHEPSQSLSALPELTWGFNSMSGSPKTSADADRVLLHNYSSSRGNLAWAVFEARTGKRIATSDELQNSPYPFLRIQDPALSPSGEIVFRIVENGRIEAWNVQSKSLARELSYSNAPFTTLVPSADDRYLLALVLDAAADDLMVLIDTETNQSVYTKLKRDPDIFYPPGNGSTFVVGFTRTLKLSPSGTRFYLSTVQGFEAFDLLTGETVEDGAAFVGKAIASRYVAGEKCWVTVFETGRVRIEPDDASAPNRWLQLPSTTGVEYAAIDVQSGSVAFQRDTAFYITHPFDEREDQWIGNLSLGIYPISLHGGGKWLAAHYRGICDLETESWLSLGSEFYARYAIDKEAKRCALYDPSRDAILIATPSTEARVEISFAEGFSMSNALAFSPDGEQLYVLVSPKGGDFNAQSIRIFDIASGSMLDREIPINNAAEEYPFTQMRVHPSENSLVLGRRNGTVRSINVDTGALSLPAFIEPLYSADWDNGIYDLSAPSPDGAYRFADEYGDLYELQQGAARQVPLTLNLTANSESVLNFEKASDRTYWIQYSKDLGTWTTTPDQDAVKLWFAKQDAGFFRVFESDPSPTESQALTNP
ncbi:hypothetical protein [Pelagicoccus sp. SDUM812005]|uniref:hypothetical protein n=1 Tax=Pelagicoccus sp. SDUM812005 TaxID=3041257 RepID=UPI00281180C9|nr:hypothetical protein [Pelagicoccus sp. SDUM812005]